MAAREQVPYTQQSEAGNRAGALTLQPIAKSPSSNVIDSVEKKTATGRQSRNISEIRPTGGGRQRMLMIAM
jgi:hypothetical protein